MPTKSPYKLQYNGRGLVIPPQAADTPVGFLTILIGFIIPFAAFVGPTEWPVAPIVLQHTPTFRAFEAIGILSEDKVAEIEFLFLLHLIMRLALFPNFKKKQLSQFSQEQPPPFELRDGWPRQLKGTFKFGLVGIVLPLTWGLVAEPLHYLSLKLLFCTLGVLGGGISFFTEGLMDLGLYAILRRQYWRESSGEEILSTKEQSADDR